MTALAWALAALGAKGREPLERWLAAVRKTVRDDKYLLRQELQDYDEQTTTASAEAGPQGGRAGSGRASPPPTGVYY